MIVMFTRSDLNEEGQRIYDAGAYDRLDANLHVNDPLGLVYRAADTVTFLAPQYWTVVKDRKGGRAADWRRPVGLHVLWPRLRILAEEGEGRSSGRLTLLTLEPPPLYHDFFPRPAFEEEGKHE